MDADNKTRISASVLSESEGDSVTIVVTNISGTTIRVQLPNPYTKIEFFDDDEIRVVGLSVFTWEESDPEVTLSPGGTVTAIIALRPFWYDMYGNYQVNCNLGVALSEGEFENITISGRVSLNLGPLTPRKRSSEPNLLAAQPRLINVSENIKIVNSSE